MSKEKLLEVILFERKLATKMSEKYCNGETSEYSWWDGYWQALSNLQAWIESEEGNESDT